MQEKGNSFLGKCLKEAVDKNEQVALELFKLFFGNGGAEMLSSNVKTTSFEYTEVPNLNPYLEYQNGGVDGLREKVATLNDAQLRAVLKKQCCISMPQEATKESLVERLISACEVNLKERENDRRVYTLGAQNEGDGVAVNVEKQV